MGEELGVARKTITTQEQSPLVNWRGGNRINTPLAYSDNLYLFKQNVDLVRARVRWRLGRDRDDVTNVTA